MDDKLRKILMYRYFRMLYKGYIKEFPNNPMLAFGAALAESAKAQVKDRDALAEWSRKYGRRKGA